MKEQYTEPGGQLRFQPAFEQCRRQAFFTVTTNLAELLRHADDALLDFADRAQNNTIQQEFFSARGVILTHGPLVQNLFQNCFNRAFYDLGQRVSPRSSGGSADGEQELGLSLLSVVEMDEDVATETLVHKVMVRCYTELYALRLRLSVVAGGSQLGEDDLPAGPYHLVQCFRTALQGLDIDAKVRMILYVLFDKYVMKDIETLYRQLNETLRKAGVLPNLKYLMNPGKNAEAARFIAPEEEANARHPEQQPEREAGANHRADTESEESAEPLRGASDELMTAIFQLMAGRRAQVPASAASNGVAISGRFGAGVNRVQRETLIATLNSVQSRSRARNANAFTDPAAAALLGSNRDFVESEKAELAVERNAFFSQVKLQRIEPMDVDAIDIVGLLFEYMLNDPTLPNLAKALLSRLHTPYLKVALLDRQFLYDDNHCARELLDLMVEAGESYVRESVPAWGIFPTLRSIVERVLAEFTDKLSLFDELLELLRARVKEQRCKTTTLEERARQAAMGRDKFHAAKQRAAAEIDQRIRHPYVLPEVAAFLSRVWLHQLVFVLLRSPLGEDAGEWRQALQIADQLVSLGDGVGAAASKDRIESTIPRLLHGIESGLDSLGGSRPGEWLSLAPLLADQERLRRRVDEVTASASAQPHDTIALGQLVKGMIPGVKATGQKGGESAAPVISASEADMVARLRDLEFGTWFEFRPADGSPPRRLKMSWFSTVTETCMFVDRGGMQSETRTMLSLAQDLLGQRARIITYEEKKPFVARALSAMLNMLKASSFAAPAPVQGEPGQRG